MATSRRATSGSEPEREMTAQDWKALYLTMRLSEQIVLHGSSALETFIDAMVESRRPLQAPESTPK